MVVCGCGFLLETTLQVFRPFLVVLARRRRRRRRVFALEVLTISTGILKLPLALFAGQLETLVCVHVTVQSVSSGEPLVTQVTGVRSVARVEPQVVQEAGVGGKESRRLADATLELSPHGRTLLPEVLDGRLGHGSFQEVGRRLLLSRDGKSRVRRVGRGQGIASPDWLVHIHLRTNQRNKMFGFR